MVAAPVIQSFLIGNGLMWRTCSTSRDGLRSRCLFSKLWIVIVIDWLRHPYRVAKQTGSDPCDNCDGDDVRA